MTMKEKIRELKVELESWKTTRKNYDEDPRQFVKGYIAGAIESLKRAIEILEEK